SSWRNLRRQYSDPISASLEYDHWQGLRALCRPLSDADVDYLRVLAQQKLEYSAALFRFNAVVYVTLPVSALVVINQLAPEWIDQLVSFFAVDEEDDEADRLLLFINYTIAALATVGGIALLFNNVYKARELRMALEIEAGRRRLIRGEHIASAGGDTTDLSL
ncbi:MAG: hypothetical protein AAGJ50_14340, partial [Pseudomonadota bacterium]